MLTVIAMLAAVLADPLEPSAPTPSAAAQGVEAVVVTARKPVAGDLQKGTLAYTPSFFTAVRPASALDMVNWLPGFVFEDTRDMRGLEGSTGNVLIDGKPPTSKTDTLTSVLRRIPSDQVERVDLIVGGAPGIDMHGRSVIANVVLKARDKPLRVGTLASYVDTHSKVTPEGLYTLSDKSGGKVLEASIDIQRNIAIFPGFGYGPWVRRDGSGAVLFAANQSFQSDGPSVITNASYEFPLGKGRLRFNGLTRYFGTQLDEVSDLTTAPIRYTFRGRSNYGQVEAGMHYERPLGRFTLEAQALERGQVQGVHEAIDRPPQPSGDSVYTYILESVQRSVLHYKRGEALSVDASLEHAFNESYNHTHASLNGLPLVLPVAMADLTENRWETGAAVSWKPSGKFSLDAALKGESSGIGATGDIVLSRRQSYAKPRLALTWSPDKDTQLRLRAEHEVGQIPFAAVITFNDYASGQIHAGNPDIRPNRALTVEAVFERHFWSTGDLTLTARSKVLKDVLDDVPRFAADGSTYETITNIGDGRETDLIGNLMIPLKRFGLQSSNLRAVVTWQKARVTDPVSGLQRALSNYPELQEELHFAQDFAEWKTNWGIDAFWRGGTTRYLPFGNEAVDGWPHVNVFVEHRFEGELALRVEVQNLPGASPKQTISVFSGLRDRSPLDYVDEKRLSVGPLLYLRLRKTFD